MDWGVFDEIDIGCDDRIVVKLYVVGCGVVFDFVWVIDEVGYKFICRLEIDIFWCGELLDIFV